MFENVIIDSDLIPLREAASSGDLKSMCQLARHIIEGNGTTLSIETTQNLIEKITAHPDYGKEREVVRDTLKLITDHTSGRYLADEIGYLEYVKGMKNSLKELIKLSIDYPFENWPIEELKGCFDWLSNCEKDLKEYLDSGGE